MTFPTRWILTGCLLAAAGADAARAAEDRSREHLAGALLASRMRELGLLLAREAYTAHARTLEGRPPRQGVVLFYLGLVEVEFGDVFRAAEYFTQAAGRLPESSPLRRRAEVWKDGLASGEAPVMTGNSPPPWWWKRIAAAGDAGWRDAVNASDADPATLPDDERIDAILAWRNDPAAGDAVLRAAEQLTFTPRDRVWLQELANSEDDVEYLLFDPGLWTAILAARTHRLDASLGDRGDLEAGVIRLWSRLLSGRLAEAETLFDQLASNPATDEGRIAERSELACLGTALAQRLQRPDRFQHWRERMMAESEGLPRAVPLWGLRALDLAERQGALRLDVGQTSIRSFTGGHDPFETRLLFPRRLTDRPAAEELRDYYFELAWAYRALHREKHGTRVPEAPDLPILSAERIMAHLASPLMRLPGAPWPLLRTIMHADVLCRSGDWESWQNHLSDRDELSEPAVGILRTLGRGAAAAVRIRSVRTVRHRDEEQLPETVATLLTSRHEFADDPTHAATIASEPDTPSNDRSQWLRRILWRLGASSVLCTLAIMSVLAWFFRPDDAPPDEVSAVTPTIAPSHRGANDAGTAGFESEWVIESPGRPIAGDSASESPDGGRRDGVAGSSGAVGREEVAS